MPFEINLDICVEYAARGFPYILGNLMVNDYIQGLDHSRRLSDRRYLAMFDDSLNPDHRAEATKTRFIVQHSANNADVGEKSRINPADAPLAFSIWYQKWYLGVGRLYDLFDALFAHMQKLKDLLDHQQAHEQVGKIFSTEVEEAIIGSICRVVFKNKKGLTGIEVKWYREHLEEHTSNTLSEWFAQRATFHWPGKPVGSAFIAIQTTKAGVQVPGDLTDKYYNQHPDFLKQLFGAESGSRAIADQPVGRLIQRSMSQAMVVLQQIATGAKRDFDFLTTFQPKYEGCYSPVVCVGAYLDLSQAPRAPIQASVLALPGIAMIRPDRPATAMGSKDPFLVGLRTDLARIIALGAPRPAGSGGLLMNYGDARDHEQVVEMMARPCVMLSAPGGGGPLTGAAFWPPHRPDFAVPRETLGLINMISNQAVAWKSHIKQESVPFKPIGHGSVSAQNRKPAILVQPEAVRPAEVPAVPKATAIVLAGGSDALGEKRTRPDGSEASLHTFNSSQRTGGSPPPKKPQEVVTTENESAHLWWGAAILAVLGLVTFRKQIIRGK